ncbi:hypothetical protein MMPV_007017 [Pyropia vietnamensis]
MVTPRSGGRPASVLFLTIALWLLFGRHGPPCPPPRRRRAASFSPPLRRRTGPPRRLALANAAAAAGGTPSSLSSAPGDPRRSLRATLRGGPGHRVSSSVNAANSNWKYLLRRLEGYGDYANLSKLHNPALSGLRYLSDYSAGEAATLLADPTYTKFVFVRDLYTRLLSAYMDKIASTQPAFVHAEPVPSSPT